MKQTKRFFAVLLAVIMLTSTFVFTSSAATLVWPVPGHTPPSSLSQGFHSNSAIDISDGSIAGATIVAAFSGTVKTKYTCTQQHHESSGDCGGFGTGLIILGDDNRQYVYAHMEGGSIPSNVYVGARVNAGQTIGRVGTTGNSSGYHLHFGIWNASGYAVGINPLNETYTYSTTTNTVTVTFNGNGGTPSASSRTFTVGEKYGDTFPSATGREGYSFDGWYSSATGGSRYGRNSIVSADIKTLYAHWSKNTANVLKVNHVYKIYNKNSGLPWQASDAGSNVCQQEDNSSAMQLWRVTYADANGYYKFQCLYGGNALEMDTINTYGYLNHLQVWGTNNNNSQVFSLVKREDSNEHGAYYSIHSKNSGRTCDVTDQSKEPGASVCQWDCHLADNQLFYFVEIEDREIKLYDNLNNNYLPSPREVYEVEGSVTPENCYASRNASGVTVTINPNSDSLTINQITPGKTADMKWIATTNDSNTTCIYELDDTTMELHFKAKASVSGAKIWFRWGYDWADSDYYPVALTTSWADYTLRLPRTKLSGNNLHPYIDKACTVEMKEIAMYAEGTEGYIGDTDAFTCSVIPYNVNDEVCYLSAPTATKEGCVFDGWYTRRVGGTRVAGANEYYNISSVPGSQCLYAHWSNHTHTYTVTLSKPATCIAEGVKIMKCSTCGAVKAENPPIDSNNHVNTVNIAATASTCTVNGYTAGVYCNDCKKYISGHQQQPLAAHTITIINQRDATQDAEGYTGDEYCTVCKQTIKQGTVIQKLDKPADPTPVTPDEPENLCPWCGGEHTGFFGGIVGFFHRIFAAIFGARY